jgi:hypothetical protein
MDATLKTYETGKYAGKFILYLCSDKAKKCVPDTVPTDDRGNKCIAGVVTEAKEKAIEFLNRNRLFYEEVIIK